MAVAPDAASRCPGSRSGDGSRGSRCAPAPRRRRRPRSRSARRPRSRGATSSDARRRGVEFLRQPLAGRRRRGPPTRTRVIARCRSAAARRDATDCSAASPRLGPASTACAAAALPGPAADHQALEQAVGRQPVRAVHAGAGHLARGEQPGQFGAAVHVGDHAAAAVVRARHHRNRLRASGRCPRPGTPP